MSDSTVPTNVIEDDSNRTEAHHVGTEAHGAKPAGVASQPEFFVHPTSTGNLDIVETIGQQTEHATELDDADIARNTAKQD